MPSRYGGITGTEQIANDYQNINIAFENVEADVDAKAAIVSNHINDNVRHVTEAEHTKLASVQPGAEPNQNAFSRVNGMDASTPTDELTIVGDVGVTVTQNPNDKSIHLTVTGESAPGPHAATHLTGGIDPIPVATGTTSGLMPPESFQAIADNTEAINDITAQLAEIRNDLLDRSINVMSPPPPLVAATGDGISGDGERIQAIINRAATDGVNVFFPPREFLIDEPLVVPNTSKGLRLWGCGFKSKLLLGFNGHLITFPEIPNGLSLCQHVISDLCFVGNGRDSGDLIHAEYVSCLYIERNMFLGLSATGNGIYVGGNPNANESSHDIFIRDNYFDSYNQPGHAAIYLDDLAADMQLSRNIMELRYTVDYGLYIRNCGSLQSFDNHFYNCNKNVLKINGASGKHYMFDNDFIDNSNEDVINIDGTDIPVANGSISFKGCLFMRPGNGYSYICLVKNVYNVSIVDCAFTNPPSGSRSAIRAIDSVTVNDILIDRNIFTNPLGYANGVIENIFGFRCIIQNNLGYKKTVNGMSWFSLNSWVEFPGQSSGMLYLGLYTTDSNDGAIIVHYREGTSGIDFNIFSGKVAGATDGNSPLLIAVPVSPNANIRIDAASNVAIQSKVFVPFNV